MEPPVLVYDDDCGFCTWWADFFAPRTDITLVGFSELDEDTKARLPEDYTRCSHLVTETAVYSCGQSLEETFIRSDLGRPARSLVQFLREFEDYNTLRERTYRWVANNRDHLGRILSKTPPARTKPDE